MRCATSGELPPGEPNDLDVVISAGD